MQHIKDVRQWLCWQLRDGRKVPVSIDGHASGSTHTHDYVSWDEASDAATKPELHMQGPAFCFTDSDGCLGVDLDSCLLPDFSVKDWAKPIVQRLSPITYGEISPSLTGLKFYGHGRKTMNGCETSVEDGEIEVYEHGRFFAYTSIQFGEVDQIGDIQDAIDWLADTYWTKPDHQSKVSHAEDFAAQVFQYENTDSQRRAKDYCDKADRPRPGSRNSSAFRLAGHLIAIGGLSPEDIYGWVAYWNCKLPEPLGDDEIKRCCENAATHGTPRDQKPAKTASVKYPSAEPWRIAEDDAPSNVPPKEKLDFPDVDTPGILREIIEYNLRTAMYPQPEMALGGAIAFLGALFGRKIQDDLGTRTNIYIVSVGPTTCGKNWARKINKRIESEAESSLLGEEDLASGSGLVSSLVQRNSCLFQLDEMGKMFASLNSFGAGSHLRQIPKLFLELWSSSDDGTWRDKARADRDSNMSICQPNACIYGTTTPETFWASLTAENAADGLLGRFLMLEGSRVLPQQPKSEPIPSEIIDFVKNWYGMDSTILRPTPPVAVQTEQAKQRHWQHLMSIAKKMSGENPLHSAIWGRVAEKSAKLALIFAAAEHTDRAKIEIANRHMNAAIAICNWSARRMVNAIEENIAESLFHLKINKAMAKITQDNGAIRKRDLVRSMHVSPREMNDLIDHLEAAELAWEGKIEGQRGVWIVKGERPQHDLTKVQVEFRSTSN